MRTSLAALALLSASTSFFAPATGWAEPAFAMVPVSDPDLARAVGTFLPSRDLRFLADTQARGDLRVSSDLGTITFDNWFNDVGTPLIINARLAAVR